MSHDSAPAVAYPVGRTPALGWLLGGLWLAGAAAVFGAVAAAPGGRGLAALLAGAAVLVCAGACLAFWRGQRPRTLLWDGERWSLEPPAGGAEFGDGAWPRVRLDLQRVMLLGLAPPQGRRVIWLWAVAAHDPARWHLLRCALYFSICPDAAQPPAGEGG